MKELLYKKLMIKYYFFVVLILSVFNELLDNCLKVYYDVLKMSFDTFFLEITIIFSKSKNF